MPKRLVWLAGWAAALVLWLWPAPAAAHAVLARSQPEANARLATAPAAVELWFTEPLETGISTARLLRTTGQAVATGAALVDPDDPLHMTLPLGHLEPGIYTVVWQTLSQADGHEWSGSFPFTVLNADGSLPAGGALALQERNPTPGPLEAVGRWLALLGGALFFAAPLFVRLFIDPPPSEGEAIGGPLRAAAYRLATQAVGLAALAMLLGAALQLVPRALRLGGLDTLPDLLFATRSGSLLLARQALALTGGLALLAGSTPLRGWQRRLSIVAYLGLVVTMLALLTATLRGQLVVGAGAVILSALVLGATWAFTGDGAPSERQRRTLWDVLLALAALALLTYSLSGHPRAISAGAVVSDWMHLLCAAAWVGGLVLLALLLWQTRAVAGRPVALLAGRFSFLAAFAVMMLVITGLFGAAVQLPTLDSLWTTAYGRALLVKLALVALLLGVAFLNNRLVRRRADGLDATGAQRLQRQVAVEGVIAVAVMLSVAVLVQTPTPGSPAPAAAPPPSVFDAIVQGGDLSAHLQVTPNRVGDSRFWLHLYHDDGSPIGDVQLVRLLFAYQEQDLGQSQLVLSPIGSDTFAADGANLSQPGRWQVSIYVRRRGLDDVLMAVMMEVLPPAP